MRSQFTARWTVLFVGLISSLTTQGQSPRGSAAAPVQQAPSEFSSMEDLREQLAVQEQQIQKLFESQSEQIRQAEAALHRDLLSAIPTFLWCLLICGTLISFRDELRSVLRMLIARLRVGGSVKLGSIEVGAVIATPARIEKAEQSRTARSDDGRRQRERADYYDRARRVMLVHRLSPSTEEGQLYDILIYVVPAIQGSLASVAQVEYFFGAFGWKNQIFTAFDRSRGFPVLTAAYGPFLCTAEVTFTDGVSVMLHRFIDFEMGNLVTYAEPTSVLQEPKKAL